MKLVSDSEMIVVTNWGSRGTVPLQDTPLDSCCWISTPAVYESSGVLECSAFRLTTGCGGGLLLLLELVSL